jgi:GT2 family glycosyltransferase
MWTSLQIDVPSDIPPMVEIVAATRLPAAKFWNESALGISIRRMAQDRRVVARVLCENRQGLASVYNSRIDADDNQEIMAFVHDDVWIDDYMLADRLLDALARYDVVGVAGNRRRLPGQSTWTLSGDTNDPANLDWGHLSGQIAHGQTPFSGHALMFGSAPADCELLDGVFLAAKRATLRNTGLRFDPRFDFHFYDLDFCRAARAQGLRQGTWPIALTHQSKGAYNTPAWQEGRRRYLDKWQEPGSPGPDQA